MKKSMLAAAMLLLLAVGTISVGQPARANPIPVQLYFPLVINQLDNPADTPVLLVSDQPNPSSLAVDSQNVYWTNCDTENGSVMAWSKSRGVSHPLATGLPCPISIQQDSDSLYWLNRVWIPGLGEYTINRMPKAGGQPVELITYTHVNGSLAVDETYVYWRDYSGPVMRLPKTGGGAPEPAPVPALVFDGPDAYWLDEGGDLLRSAKDGSSVVTLVKDDDLDALAGREPSNVYITGIFPRTSELYFTVFVDNYPGFLSCTDQHTVLMRMPKGGGAYTPVISAAGGGLETLVAEPSAYFSGYCTHGLIKVDLGSQAEEALGDMASALAQDSTFVYWADSGSGWIKRIKR